MKCNAFCERAISSPKRRRDVQSCSGDAMLCLLSRCWMPPDHGLLGGSSGSEAPGTKRSDAALPPRGDAGGRESQESTALKTR